jgi:DNA polymerase III alpha subunit
MPFVHLHTHSEYSLLDGANRIPELVAHVKKLGMDSLAVTDHGNLHAAWSFYEHAKAQRIRPILGFEAYLAFGPRTAREKPAWAPAPYSHLVLLARNRSRCISGRGSTRRRGKVPSGSAGPSVRTGSGWRSSSMASPRSG